MLTGTKEEKIIKSIKPIEEPPFNPFEYEKRDSVEVSGIGGSNVPQVVTDYSLRNINKPEDLADIGYFYNAETDKWNMSDNAPDIIFLGENEVPFDIPNGIRPVYNYDFWLKNNKNGFPLISSEDYLTDSEKSQQINFVLFNINEFQKNFLIK